MIWEFLDSRGNGIVEAWLRKRRIQKKAIATLNQKIDLLEQYGPEAPGLLVGPIHKEIYKLTITAQGVQLRPMVCKGPINNDTEFTLLLGAIERDDRLKPSNAPQRAAVNRQEILKNPLRRRHHEQFPWQD